jgi:heme oxygenase (mycobilin-producing)
MAVKVLIERRIEPRARRTVIDAMKRMRQRCLDEPGYISGETLFDNNDENHIVVISTWFGLMDWKRWQASEDRQAYIDQIQPHLREPDRVLVMLEGLSERVAGA